MALSNRDPWDDRFAHLGDFPDHVLVDIARNEAAEHRYRLFAVELLVNRKSPKVKHPELYGLVRELAIELDGIQFEYPAPSSGPLVASVTTESINSPEVIQPVAEKTLDIPIPPVKTTSATEVPEPAKETKPNATG